MGADQQEIEIKSAVKKYGKPQPRRANSAATRLCAVHCVCALCNALSDAELIAIDLRLLTEIYLKFRSTCPKSGTVGNPIGASRLASY
jgi:hypothetical protein